MLLRFTGLALATALLVPFGAVPSAEAQGRGPARAARLVLPITGTVEGGGSFTGTLALREFAAQGNQVVAVGMISGTVTGPAGQRRSGVQGPVELPVAVGEATGTGPAIQPQRGSGLWFGAPPITLAQQEACGVLHLEIGATTIDLLGLMVALDPVVLDISGDSAGVLGNLVCQVLGVLNNVVNLVGLLNQILGLLGGLTGTVPA